MHELCSERCKDLKQARGNLKGDTARCGQLWRCVCLSVHLSVCVSVTAMSYTEIAKTIETLFGMWTKQSTHVTRWGPGSPQKKWQFGGGISRSIVKFSKYLPEPKLFGSWQKRCVFSVSLVQQLAVLVFQ